MYIVSWNSHGKENIEYQNFLTDIFIERFIGELKAKGYTDIKVTEVK